MLFHNAGPALVAERTQVHSRLGLRVLVGREREKVDT